MAAGGTEARRRYTLRAHLPCAGSTLWSASTLRAGIRLGVRAALEHPFLAACLRRALEGGGSMRPCYSSVPALRRVLRLARAAVPDKRRAVPCAGRTRRRQTTEGSLYGVRHRREHMRRRKRMSHHRAASCASRSASSASSAAFGMRCSTSAPAGDPCPAQTRRRPCPSPCPSPHPHPRLRPQASRCTWEHTIACLSTNSD